MTRVELTVAVEVAAPAEVVWGALTAWARQGEWMLGTRVRVTDPGPGGGPEGHGIGAALEAVTGRGKVAFVDTMIITRWDPPDVCEVHHTGRVIRGEGIFRVHARGPRAASLVWIEQLDLPFGRLGALAWPLARPVARAGVAYSLRRFAAWAPTSGAAAPGPSAPAPGPV